MNRSDVLWRMALGITVALALTCGASDAATNGATAAARAKAKAMGQRTLGPDSATRRNPVAARQPGFVSGYVRNASGQTVTGAKVRLERPGGKELARPRARHATRTDGRGKFRMQLVRPGTYRIAATRDGYPGHSPLIVIPARLQHVDIDLGAPPPPPTRSQSSKQ